MEAEFDNIHHREGLQNLVLEPSTDRISQLPDDILYHILSFLPQENLVNVLFLSKRWLSLSTNLPILCFNFKSDSKTDNSLLNFLEKTLSFRGRSVYVEKFCLSSSSRPCRIWLDEARVNDLIREVVLKHGVREIDLNLANGGLQFISPCHVSCNSLTSLKLCFDTSSKQNFPVSFSFPNLKTMELRYVNLGSNIASQLSNNCRKLENLFISNCSFVLIPNSNCSLRTLPKLLKASLSMNFFYQSCAIDFFPVISNVEVLSLNFPDLFLDEHEKLDYFSKFNHLKRFEFGTFVNWETMVNVIDNLLRSSPALEYLSVDYYCNYYVSDLIPSCRLSESLKVVKMEGLSPAKHLIKLAKYFLEEAKGLKKIIVKPPRCLFNEAERDDIRQKLQALPNSGSLELYNLCEDDTCGRWLSLPWL